MLPADCTEEPSKPFLAQPTVSLGNGLTQKSKEKMVARETILTENDAAQPHGLSLVHPLTPAFPGKNDAEASSSTSVLHVKQKKIKKPVALVKTEVRRSTRLKAQKGEAWPPSKLRCRSMYLLISWRF